jgi:hypothetical protein
MAALIANQSAGRVAQYASLPATNDALILVLMKSAGAEALTVLQDYDTLLAVLAATNDECDFTNYSRKTLAGITVTVDDTNNRVDIDCNDVVYTSAGGASNNTGLRAGVFYDPDTTGGTDADLIPVGFFDASFTTNGNNLNVNINASGLLRAAA